jgi:cystathionine beta-lyase
MHQIDTMAYDFDTIPNRRNSDSTKWNYYDDDVLPMWVADMDFVSPEPVLRALHDRIDEGIFGYLDLKCTKLKQVQQIIIARLAETYNWRVEPEDILYFPGVVAGFHLACDAFVERDKKLLVQTPVYHPILNAAQTTGVIGHKMQLTQLKDGAYEVNWEQFEDSIGEQTALFILCNPHNPIGKVFTKPELERTAEICLKKDVIICSDEIHSDLVYPDYSHIPIASLDSDIAQNTITLLAPSKTYNIPGLQFSIAIIQNPAIRQRFRHAARGLVSSVNLMGLTAAHAAYQYGEPWRKQLMNYLEENRDFLYQTVQDELPGITMHRPEGTYLAWLDCRQAGMEGSPGNFFLEKGRVAFNDGAMFGHGGEGFVRLNFGCPRQILKEGVKRIQQALDTL